MKIPVALVLFTYFGVLRHTHAQTPRLGFLDPIPLPNTSYCETTALTLDETSFEFRWSLKGLQEYYETVRKFYDTVYFTKRIPDSSRQRGLVINVKVGITARSLTGTVTVSPSKAEDNANASFAGQLLIKSRHGSASYPSTKVSQLPESMEFRWFLTYTEREEVGRLLEIYTDAIVTHPPRASVILANNSNKNVQMVTLSFKIIQYGLSPILTFDGARKCEGKDLN